MDDDDDQGFGIFDRHDRADDHDDAQLDQAATDRGGAHRAPVVDPDPDDAGEPALDAHHNDHAELLGGLGEGAHGRRRSHRRQGRWIKRGILKILWTLVALAALVGIVAGVIVGVQAWQQHHEKRTDWAGVGDTLAVVRVQSGDGLFDVGRTLVDAGVVADSQVFVSAAQKAGSLTGLQPGYYAVHLHSSAQEIVKELADADHRIGQLRIIPGQRLADVTAVATDGTTSVRKGILSTIADACVPTGDEDSCFSVDDLWQVEQTASPSDLGVVGWAMEAIDQAPDPRKRLEGLILPGDYDIAPGATAEQALSTVVSASAVSWNNTAIVSDAKQLDMTPYQLATVASLVQAEVIGSDMPKAARVIYNRLDDGMKLQFDSTVNYGLDRAQISTSNDERLDPANLYSTYAHYGLTPTPIGAPGPKAVDAAIDPAIGDWLYFVAIDTQGTTCFSDTFAEHEQCVDKARANGVFG